MTEFITTTQKLLEYDDNSYYAIDYTGALQTIHEDLQSYSETSTMIVNNQLITITLLGSLIGVLIVLIFVLSFKFKNY